MKHLTRRLCCFFFFILFFFFHRAFPENLLHRPTAVHVLRLHNTTSTEYKSLYTYFTFICCSAVYELFYGFRFNFISYFFSYFFLILNSCFFLSCASLRSELLQLSAVFLFLWLFKSRRRRLLFGLPPFSTPLSCHPFRIELAAAFRVPKWRVSSKYLIITRSL